MASDPGARRAEDGLTRKGAQTRQRIVAAAADLILQQGVAGTTLDDVRAETGVSSSQIYHYFADKEALVRAVVDYRAQTVVRSEEYTSELQSRQYLVCRLLLEKK